jgi:hypothetical protein
LITIRAHSTLPRLAPGEALEAVTRSEDPLGSLGAVVSFSAYELVRMRLDEDRLEALRRWGRGLEQAGGEESAAAGRAILMLISEIEQLQIDLRLVGEQLSRVGLPSSDEAAGSPEEPFASTLHERLQRVLGRDSESSRARPQSGEESGSGMGTDRTTTSPQAWLETLRRHR